MTYLVGDKKYSYSYSEMRELYYKFIGYSDEQFLQELTSILHFTCFIAYVKELPNECTLSDLGIIHEMVHLKLLLEENFMIEDKEELIKQVREQFKLLIKLD